MTTRKLVVIIVLLGLMAGTAAAAGNNIFGDDATNVACVTFMDQHVQTTACGEANWPKGTHVVLFTRKTIRLYSVVNNRSQIGKVLATYRR